MENLDFIVVLGTLIYKKKGQLFLDYEDPYSFYSTTTRMNAIDKLQEENPTMLFLLTGGDHNGINRSELLKEFLTEVIEVDGANLIPIGRVPNTFGNSSDVINYLTKNKIKAKKFGLLTNQFHMERALTMFKARRYFIDNKIEIVPIIAEDIIFRDIVTQEKQGTDDFKRGAYKL